jgi:signal transduction histidine kinase
MKSSNENKIPLSFIDSVLMSIKPGQLKISLSLSAIAGILFASAFFYQYSNANAELIQSIASHLSTLVETQDRPELLRMINSMAEQRGADFLIVQDNSIIATTRSTTELETTFKTPVALSILKDLMISSSQIINRATIERAHGPNLNAQIYIISPLKPVLITFCLVYFAAFCILFLFNKYYANQLTSVIEEAIAPIKDLNHAISKILVSENNNFQIAPIGITELDHIRSTILETRRELIDATDRLAHTKSQELVSEGYRQLIHDIYSPVAALREILNLSESLPQSDENRNELNLKTVKLAEQILNQVSTANNNLEYEPKILLQNDIRKCVFDAIEEATLAFSNRNQITIKSNLPEYSILVPHDPIIMQRAVSNLVSNALRASKQNVEIEIDKINDHVSIRISDDGEGIDPDKITQLLQGRLLSQNGNRPGIGLPSANHIAKLHGGRLIYKKSKLGGATFEIRI